MRRLIFALALAGCSPPLDEGARYLADPTFRREALVASLERDDNRYARLRLSAYGRAWEKLPEWNPPVASLDGEDQPLGDEHALDLDQPLVALGREAFFRYPAQMAPRLGAGIASAAIGVPVKGAVAVRLAGGRRMNALTCAGCHARLIDGELVPGLANQDIDLGALLGGPWPRGTLDVAMGGGEAPVAIPDLRPVSLQSHLQASGAVKNGRVALAIRIETLILTAHGASIRPPRIVALALADYLATLQPPTENAGGRGEQLFAQRCAGCHRGEERAGPPVDAAVVGGDARAAESLDRGTGGYRAPSLRGVATRGRLLHDASVADLDALFDPMRTSGGHRFAHDLDAVDRAALLAFLARL